MDGDDNVRVYENQDVVTNIVVDDSASVEVKCPFPDLIKKITHGIYII